MRPEHQMRLKQEEHVRTYRASMWWRGLGGRGAARGVVSGARGPMGCEHAPDPSARRKEGKRPLFLDNCEANKL